MKQWKLYLAEIDGGEDEDLYPCCRPKEWGSVKVLYMSGEDLVTDAEIHGMTVESCGC